MDLTAFRHDFFLILPEVELALFGLAILLLISCWACGTRPATPSSPCWA